MVGGHKLYVEVGASHTLPVSVLLETDVLNLVYLLKGRPRSPPYFRPERTGFGSSTWT